MQRVTFFGVEYLWMMNHRGTLYLGKIKRVSSNIIVDPQAALDDQGQKKDYSDDEGTHYWFNCSAVQPSDPPPILQFRRTNVGNLDQLWDRGHLAGPF